MSAIVSETQERLDQLNRDGFILIPNALPPERVEQWKTVLYALYDRGAYEISNGVGNVAFEKLLALEPELAGKLVGHASVAPFLHAIMGKQCQLRSLRAHVNPAVTIGLLVGGKISGGKAVGYIISQLVGGTIAGLLLRAIYPVSVWAPVNLGTPGLGEGVSAGTGVLVEIILTFFLVTAVYGTAVDEKAPKIGGFGIGLVLVFDILMGGPLTGASMNPARTFGPAVASGFWDAHWVYWVGPIAGGILAAIAYKLCSGGSSSD